ncbi:MAG TPA: alpha/beta fold hydrolase [Frankiaceae bacterium]|nr:alpha/beta fold hydrolase [Frankiaceae bacterium]
MTTTLERRVPTGAGQRSLPPVPRVPAAGLALAGLGWAAVATGHAPDAFSVLRVAAAVAAVGAAGYGLTRRVRVAGWSALAAGTLALTVGIGIGSRWLQKAPATLPAIGGAAGLLGSLVLLSWAGVVLLRAARGWHAVAALPVGIAVVLTVLTTFPALVATNVPPTGLGSRTPASYGLAFTDVTFRTSDGVRLSAWWVAGTNGAAVVVRHGSGSTRSSTLDQSAVLARHGYGVLLVDARGHGRSGGTGMDWGWYGDLDTSAAVTYVTEVGRATRVGVLGLSMGGEEAIGAAASDRRIRAVVAEGATGRNAADRDVVLPRGVNGRVQRVLDVAMFGLADLLTGASVPPSLRDAARRASVPTLLVAAGEVADEATAAEAVRAASPSTVGVWVVPGASHTRGLAAEPAAWEARVVAFLDAALTS